MAKFILTLATVFMATILIANSEKNIWEYSTTSSGIISKDGWQLAVTWTASKPGNLTLRRKDSNSSMFVATPADGDGILDLRDLILRYDGVEHPITNVTFTETIFRSNDPVVTFYASHVVLIKTNTFIENNVLKNIILEKSSPVINSGWIRYQSGTKKIEKISITPGPKSLPYQAYYNMPYLNCDISGLVPKDCTTLESMCLADNGKLTGKLVLTNLISIAGQVFYNQSILSSIKDLEIHSSNLTTIHLRGLTQVTNLVLHMPNLSQLGSNSIFNHYALQSLTINSTNAFNDNGSGIYNSLATLKQITFGGKKPPNATLKTMLNKAAYINVNGNYATTKPMTFYASSQDRWGWSTASDVMPLTDAELAIAPKGTFGVWCSDSSATKRIAWVIHKHSVFDPKPTLFLIR